MRNAFSERRDTMNALKDLLREQRLAAQQVDRTARRKRHELANRANRAELKAALLEEGVPLESVRARLDRTPPLYDLDAEDKAEDDLIHQTEAAGRLVGKSFSLRRRGARGGGHRRKKRGEPPKRFAPKVESAFRFSEKRN